MRFIHVDPTAKTVKAVFAVSPHDAHPKLHTGNVDHGVVYRTRARGVGIVVWEHGLLEGAGPYFELAGQLYSGDAILYGFDAAGETTDMPAFTLEPHQWRTDLELVLMFVTEHPNRWLINMSRAEMDALRKLINAGFLLLEGEDGDGMWRHFTLAERKVIGHWRRKDPTQPTGPRRQQHLPPSQKRRKPKLNDGLSSVA